MSIIKKMRKAFAVYWEPGSNDGYGGTAFSAPIEIKVRWEDTQELIIDKNGQEIVAKSLVYVDRVLNLDGYLFRGKLTDLGNLDSSEDPDDPTTIQEAFEIRKFAELPKLNYREVLLTAWL